MKSTGFPADVVELILCRSGGNCEILATGCQLLAAEIHHRRARGMGGTNRPETNAASNGLAVCRRCHIRVESQRHWAFENGFAVRQCDDPRWVPVWWRCHTDGYGKELVFLDETGHFIEYRDDDWVAQ